MMPTDFFAAKIASAKTLEESAKFLGILCSGSIEIQDDGSAIQRRHLVDQVNGLRISIQSNEHPPPHFHVRGGGIDASFSIFDGTHLTGNINKKQSHAVAFWYKSARALLIKTWNRTRLENCSVGPINE